MASSFGNIPLYSCQVRDKLTVGFLQRNFCTAEVLCEFLRDLQEIFVLSLVNITLV